MIQYVYRIRYDMDFIMVKTWHHLFDANCRLMEVIFYA
ncbi:hypothetical protein AG74_49 [Vibrio phage AG74]|uniref:Uncharacterized protein n=2 Tax=Thalassavirus TaxID=2948922 RepID=A0A6M9Z1T0_9CAUD|nr:hypothetical protein KNV06_gp049 [Vibrio phage AG74]YP_010114222.1 hypothetical protein KNV71_gp052 [Vibrio phage Gary]QKN84908.1 hypothetical protein AG74_49 [Vibrio phage AG74]QQV88156.1 hypothetical protein GARY_52 [Vibrio phage Gary]